MPIKLGTQVRQIMPAPVQGVVVSKTFNETTDSFQYLVETSAVPEESHVLAFNEGEVEEIATPGAAA
jgi:hypothetical protein